MLDFEDRFKRRRPTLNTIKRNYEKYLGYCTSLNRNNGNSGRRATVVTVGKIIQNAKCPTELRESLVLQLTSMSTWFFNNKLSVSTSKTEVIFFGKPVRVKTCKNMEPVT